MIDGLIELLLPKRCVQCGAGGGWLCEPCFSRFRALPQERCPRCGAPRAEAGGGRAPAGWRCPECTGRDLAFVSANAAFIYEGPARALVAACKFRALRSLADEMARLAEPAFGAALEALSVARSSGAATTFVTSVPGQRARSLERGFNQADLLARTLARGSGLPYAPVLRRVRHGTRQSGLRRAARAANVRGAFALRDDANRVLKKLKRVVVVDDVYTTGETLNHCAEVLAHADLEPHVFTFARTVRAASCKHR